MSQELKKSVLEEFKKKFIREYTIDSDPSPYIHVGLDYSFQATDILDHISFAIDKSFEAGRQQGLREAIECKPEEEKDIEFSDIYGGFEKAKIMGFNSALKEWHDNINKKQ